MFDSKYWTNHLQISTSNLYLSVSVCVCVCVCAEGWRVLSYFNCHNFFSLFLSLLPFACFLHVPLAPLLVHLLLLHCHTVTLLPLLFAFRFWPLQNLKHSLVHHQMLQHSFFPIFDFSLSLSLSLHYHLFLLIFQFNFYNSVNEFGLSTNIGHHNSFDISIILFVHIHLLDFFHVSRKCSSLWMTVPLVLFQAMSWLDPHSSIDLNTYRH